MQWNQNKEERGTLVRLSKRRLELQNIAEQVKWKKLIALYQWLKSKVKSNKQYKSKIEQ